MSLQTAELFHFCLLQKLSKSTPSSYTAVIARHIFSHSSHRLHCLPSPSTSVTSQHYFSRQLSFTILSSPTAFLPFPSTPTALPSTSDLPNSSSFPCLSGPTQLSHFIFNRTEAAQFLSWEYLFRIFGIVSLQCTVQYSTLFSLIMHIFSERKRPILSYFFSPEHLFSFKSHILFHTCQIN
jgi:hypothetical protein